MKCRSVFLLSVCFLLNCHFGYAGSATWNANPTSGDWNNAANWTPATVPNGPSDVATFGRSSILVTGPTVATEVNSIIFSPGPRLFTIQPTTGSLTISGVGITNNSSITQNFWSTSDSGSIILSNSANAGSNLAFIALTTSVIGKPGGRVQFISSASAGANAYRNMGGDSDAGSGGITELFDDSTAATATFTNDGGYSPTEIAVGGMTIFHDRSSAGNATFINNPAVIDWPGEVDFLDTSTAANATFTSSGTIKFEDSSTAANAVVALGDDVGNFGSTSFSGDSTAGNAMITMLNGQVTFSDGASAGTSTIIGNNTFGGAFVTFNSGTTLDHATLISNDSSHYYINSTASSGNITINSLGSLYCNDADNCTMTVNGAASDLAGGEAHFYGNAGDSLFTVNGASAPGENAAGLLEFYATANLETSTIIANGGTNGGLGGTVRFSAQSNGGTARVELFGNSQMRLGVLQPPLAIGSLEGEGLVVLTGKLITIGGNNLNTEFSGIIEDNEDGTVLGGQISKTGSGTLTLSGANTYTGGTVIEAGTLLVMNSEGSATGDGAVAVEAGTLGGSGTISGTVTVGTGSGSGAALSPATGTNTFVSFTTRSTLRFQSDGIYNCRFSGKARHAVSDQAVASGVTIDSGARFAAINRIRGRLRAGIGFTVISNTAATPISGTFTNLPDRGTIVIGQNTFQANYEGGDGNDLTLTVVP